ncbi:MAG: hypothetical protein IKD20_07030 [Clostridia bacterium]|nr:hypothetical protein [Clostridia bacterium]
MEKQIIIRHKNSDLTSKINTNIAYLEMFVNSNDKMVCSFRIGKNESYIIDEIMRLESLHKISVVNIGKKNCDYEIISCLKNIEQILNIIEKYELNAMIYCNDIKLFINDNDGDFIIIDSKNERYKAIKKIKII